MSKHIAIFSLHVMLGLGYFGIAVASESLGRKSGDWEISVAVAGQSPSTANYCIDAGSDDIAAAAGGGVLQSGCEASSAAARDGGFEIHSVCKQGNSTVTTKGNLTGDLENAYEGEVTKLYSPPLYGRSEIKSIVKARYLGKCP